VTIKYSTTAGKAYVMAIIPEPLGLKNPLVIQSIEPKESVECSYAGGCQIKMLASGLFYVFKDRENSYLEVCGTKVEQVKKGGEKEPTPARTVTIELPPLSTKLSNTLFKIAENTEDLKA